MREFLKTLFYIAVYYSQWGDFKYKSYFNLERMKRGQNNIFLFNFLGIFLSVLKNKAVK